MSSPADPPSPPASATSENRSSTRDSPSPPPSPTSEDSDDSDDEEDGAPKTPTPEEERLLATLRETVAQAELDALVLFGKSVIRTMQSNAAYIEGAIRRYAERGTLGPDICSWCKIEMSEDRIFRCQRGCHDQLPGCTPCIAIAHEQLPTHRLEEWVENRWEPRTLRDVGYIQQLGHEGLPCPKPSFLITVRLLHLPDGMQELWCRECLCTT
ncbi:hypothetical protein B0H11DRAFT_2242697 [Mycena galericulata]|nr:hypothetical protein B0H11DRAFT_2242697 [Mycena galericulata]